MNESSSSETKQKVEQRSQLRVPQTGPISMSIEGAQVIGRVCNASASGVMFLSNSSLRLTVDVEQGGKVVQRTGRLVRIQRLNDEDTAYAVEFDRE